MLLRVVHLDHLITPLLVCWLGQMFIGFVAFSQRFICVALFYYCYGLPIHPVEDLICFIYEKDFWSLAMDYSVMNKKQCTNVIYVSTQKWEGYWQCRALIGLQQC